jgi:hypothetical protein
MGVFSFALSFFFSLDLDLDFFYFFVFHSEKFFWITRLLSPSLPSAIAAKRIDLEENACKERRRRRGKDRRQEGEESPPRLSSFSYS